MKASAMSSDVVFSPVLSFNKNVMGMAIDNVANTVVNVSIREGANKQVISSQADSLIKISRIWADF
ncbi:hypothetical protein ELI87_28350, partial [Klebsiella pneumoniae]|nr:hypothetical protein [Klebsiella pneumoniae]MBL2213498.1 hypothetical protein [Klebsiella pneumoniae]